MRICAAILPAVLILLALGCDERTGTAAQPANVAAPSQHSTVAHPGTITGRVTFAGNVPTLAPLDTSSVPACHHPGGVPDESVVINHGSLANVIVYLKGVPASNGSSNPPALLDQVNCQYLPHVVAVQTGQVLRLKSSDSLLHNVHIADANPPVNWAFVGMQQRDCTFDHPAFLKARCDVHPWMTAWIAVVDNPCFAVTASDGTYTITGIPAGTYTLEAWHERFGKQSQPITVTADGTVQAEFEYK